MLTIRNFKVSIGQEAIIPGLSYTFEDKKTYIVMGPNGSGKSTFVQGIMGNPIYTTSGDLLFEDNSISALPTHKRAQLGIFVSFQSPPSFTGISLFQMLRVSLKGKMDVITLNTRINELAKKLHLKESVLNRPLNDGASGGERKKMELIQAVILEPKLLILDEIDTGVDIDALKHIVHMIKELKKKTTIIAITHNSRLVSYLNPDRIMVMEKGKFIKEGSTDLAYEIETNGFKK